MTLETWIELATNTIECLEQDIRNKALVKWLNRENSRQKHTYLWVYEENNMNNNKQKHITLTTEGDSPMMGRREDSRRIKELSAAKFWQA